MEKRSGKQGVTSERSSVKFCHFQNQVSSSGPKPYVQNKNELTDRLLFSDEDQTKHAGDDAELMARAKAVGKKFRNT